MSKSATDQYLSCISNVVDRATVGLVNTCIGGTPPLINLLIENENNPILFVKLIIGLRNACSYF